MTIIYDTKGIEIRFDETDTPQEKIAAEHGVKFLKDLHLYLKKILISLLTRL